MSQQQQYSRQSFLAGVEKLVNQIRFVSYVSCQQIRHEHIGKRLFPMKHIIHGFLANFHHGAVGHCDCRAQAERLSCKATLPEEIALLQNADCGFLADLRNDDEFYLSFLYIKKQHQTSRPEQRSSAFWRKLRYSYHRCWLKERHLGGY